MFIKVPTLCNKYTSNLDKFFNLKNAHTYTFPNRQSVSSYPFFSILQFSIREHNIHV